MMRMMKGCGLTGSSGMDKGVSGALDEDVRKGKGGRQAKKDGNNAEYLE